MSAEATLDARSGAVARRFDRAALAPWKTALVLVAVSRGAFFIAAYAGTQFLTAAQGPEAPEGFLDTWVRWDARHFEVVAEHGWQGPEAESARAAAFFPFYPLAMRALAWIGFDLTLAGLIVSAAATVVACAYLIKLADTELGEGAGRRAALYLILFPTAVFLIAPYSEALFLAGAIPAFYYARRGRWLAASIPAAIAVGTRAAGMFLLAGLAVELATQLWRRREEDMAERALHGVAALAIAALPLIGYGLYLEATSGTFTQYLIDQQEGWGRDFPVNPIGAFQATWNTRVGGYDSNWVFAWRIEILAALAGVLLTGWAALKREWGYTVYIGTLMVALLMSSWYFSIPRMLLSCFPAVIFLSEATHGHPHGHETALLIMAPVAVMGVIVFTRGAWFF
ncbi:MAG: mannosyltransferase family protein [Actinomycetota bacterium]